MKRLSFILLLIVCSVIQADDWPQWQGPNRDNKSAEKGLLQQWPGGGPKLVWTFNQAGTGYSSPSVVGEQLYMTGALNGQSSLFAVNVKTGKQVWSTKLDAAFTFKGNAWGDGPRAAPTVHNGHVYALSGGGQLICASTKDGSIVWSKHMGKDLNGQVNPIGGGPKDLGWGYCWAPLIDGEKLICLPGGPKGTVAALNPKTGDVLWRSKGLTEQATYASPVAADIHGVHQYVVFTQTGVSGVSAKDGALLWSYKRSRAYPDVVIPTPVVHENYVYVTAGYGAGCDLVEVSKSDDKFDAKKVYSNKYMKNTLGGVVLIDGYIYGASERRGWICQDLMKGRIKWYKKNVLNDGSLIYADGHLYCYDERDGVVALVEASTEGYKEKGRFTIPQHSKMQAPSGRKWTHPVIANGKLYIRDNELLFCFDVKKN